MCPDWKIRPHKILKFFAHLLIAKLHHTVFYKCMVLLESTPYTILKFFIHLLVAKSRHIVGYKYMYTVVMPEWLLQV